MKKNISVIDAELSTKNTITAKLDYWKSVSDEYLNIDEITLSELKIPKSVFEKYFESDFNTPEYAFWMLKYNAYQWFNAKYIDIERIEEKIKSPLGIDFAKDELKKLLNSDYYGKESEEYQRIKNGNYKYNVCDYTMGSLTVLTYAKFFCFREYLENVLEQKAEINATPPQFNEYDIKLDVDIPTLKGCYNSNLIFKNFNKYLNTNKATFKKWLIDGKGDIKQLHWTYENENIAQLRALLNALCNVDWQPKEINTGFKLKKTVDSNNRIGKLNSDLSILLEKCRLK
jgi:hypothetical protein